MRVVRWLLVWVLLQVGAVLLAQEDSLSQRVEALQEVLLRYVEAVENDMGDEKELEDLSEELSLLEEEGGKWSINALSQEVALNLLQMSDYQYYHLQRYIDQYGFLVSLNELLAIEGFSYLDLVRLRSYLLATPPLQRSRPFHHFFKRARHTLLLRYGRVLEPQAGYDTARANGYLGSPDRLSFRYKFTSSDIFSLAFSAEKDAGEQFFKGAQKYGFDHYSFSMAFKNIGVLKMAVLGDYRLNLGQGLVSGASLLGGKGSLAGVRKFASGLQPVTPLSEGSFYSGVAVELGNAFYKGILFYSSRTYDGSRDGEGVYEGTLSVTGYHRTFSEGVRKDVLRSQVVGFDFRMLKRLFRVGSRALFTFFPCVVAQDIEVYQRYHFRGKFMMNLSVDYQCLLRKMVLFGEVALCETPAWACIQGMQWHIDPRLRVAAVVRAFSPKYHSLYGSGFDGKVQNETAVYAVADLVLGKRINMLIYNDYCLYPWLKHLVDAPSFGMETGAMLSMDVHRHALVKCQYRRQQRDVNLLMEEPYWNGLMSKITHSVKLGCSYQPLSGLSMKTEVDWLQNRYPAKQPSRYGWLFYQDVEVTFAKIDLSLNCRMAFFDTPSYQERLYAYECDVSNAFTVNSYYGRGCRAVLLVKYGWRFVDVWLRFAQSYYFDSDKVGSGLTQINAPHKTELRMQCCFKW